MTSSESSEFDFALRETLYLLKRWHFAVSTKGAIWIRPTGPRLSPEELAGLIALLNQCCDQTFPRVVFFDFTQVEIVGGQWTMVYELLEDFSRSIGAHCRITFRNPRPAGVAFIYRDRSHR